MLVGQVAALRNSESSNLLYFSLDLHNTIAFHFTHARILQLRISSVEKKYWLLLASFGCDLLMASVAGAASKIRVFPEVRY